VGLLDYYKKFEGMSDAEVSAELRKRAEERRKHALAKIEPLDLSRTTWHELPHPDVVAAITYAARRGMNRPADPQALELRRELGRRHGLEPERVAVGNGASTLLRVAARLLMGPEEELVTSWPSYPLYPLMARASGGRAVPVPGHDADALFAAVDQRTRLIAVCNPNDPTGAFLPAADLRRLLERLPDHVTVLLDEALGDFVDDEDANATLELLDDFPRLLIFRTFSKAYGLAGMRCGYVLGGPGSEGLLEGIGPPLGVSDLAQAGALEALRKCGPQVTRRRAAVGAERARLADALTDLPVDGPASQANLVWLRAPGLADGELLEGLRRSGVIVHAGAEWGEPDHVRAAIQSPPATARLIEGLKAATAAGASG
jgi:histidinol-phosphate aminotransferase